MTETKDMWICDGDKLGEESPFLVIISKDPRPIKEILGYDPFADEVLPLIITVKSLDPDFDNGFHFDTVEDIEVGSLLLVRGKEEIVRVKAISTIGSERFLMFDRGFGNTPMEDIKVGDHLMVIGQDEAKDLYPLMVQTIVKDDN